jgi:hypothetical protein
MTNAPTHPDAALLALAERCESAALALARAIDAPQLEDLARAAARFRELAEQLARHNATTPAGQRAKDRIAAQANPLPPDVCD